MLHALPADAAPSASSCPEPDADYDGEATIVEAFLGNLEVEHPVANEGPTADHKGPRHVFCGAPLHASHSICGFLESPTPGSTINPAEPLGDEVVGAVAINHGAPLQAPAQPLAAEAGGATICSVAPLSYHSAWVVKPTEADNDESTAHLAAHPAIETGDAHLAALAADEVGAAHINGAALASATFVAEDGAAANAAKASDADLAHSACSFLGAELGAVVQSTQASQLAGADHPGHPMRALAQPLGAATCNESLLSNHLAPVDKPAYAWWHAAEAANLGAPLHTPALPLARGATHQACNLVEPTTTPPGVTNHACHAVFQGCPAATAGLKHLTVAVNYLANSTSSSIGVNNKSVPDLGDPLGVAPSAPLLDGTYPCSVGILIADLSGNLRRPMMEQLPRAWFTGIAICGDMVNIFESTNLIDCARPKILALTLLLANNGASAQDTNLIEQEVGYVGTMVNWFCAEYKGAEATMRQEPSEFWSVDSLKPL
ncbi:hypothetical protein L7F22_058891 [Adiantum nelumboides]|nr:hypothetical protein [Adiantum nelumboides]